VERLIGTIRREFLDHVLIWNAVDLEEQFRIITTTIGFTNRSMVALRENTLASRYLPLPSWPTMRGGTIAAVFSRCRSQRNLRIRHARCCRQTEA
jgi:hypothetical protein